MNSKWSQKVSQYGMRTWLILCLVILFITLTGLAVGTAYAENPAPVQIFYVTLPEADALTVLDGIHTAANAPMYTYFSIAIGVTETLVYYDHWEDGYATDITDPASVQIWGNGLAADGCAPNLNGVTFTCTDGNDDLDAGDVIIPYNSVDLPRDQNVIRFDAMDKVGASESIAMARAVWADGSDTLNAYAHEMYSTAEWGTAYEAPVGLNTAAPGDDMFEYSALTIMAAQNDTYVQVDADVNGSYEITDTLQEGGTILITGTLQGAEVLSDKPVQVVLLTGDVGDTYESRDMNLLPVSAFGSSYWSPVGVEHGSNPTRLWLYNPSTNSGSILIKCEHPGSTLTQSVALRGVVTFDLGANQGGHCYAVDGSGVVTTTPFSAVGTIDTAGGSGVDYDGSRTDWSFTLYPDDFLTTEALVGLGLGQDPNLSLTENGSPLWVTPVCDTYVYVDWDNDSDADLVDLNGDGDANDTDVNGIDETTSNLGMSITTLKSVRLFDPALGADPAEFAQSGARIWSRTVSNAPDDGYGGDPGCKLAIAWGQDPGNATAGEPGLDVGTSVPPLRPIEVTKSAGLKIDADYDKQLSPGDTAVYTITIRNAGSVKIHDVHVYDEVPEYTTYVAPSTQKNVGGGWQSIDDDDSGTPFPLDTTDGVDLGNLLPGETFYVRFDVTLNSTPPDYEEVENCVTVYTNEHRRMRRCVVRPVASKDWGDLPDSYGTTAAANGPRHSPSGLMLGDDFDREPQGQESTDAVGDDHDYLFLPVPQVDDEDGVRLYGGADDWWLGDGSFIVTATSTVASVPGCLNAWMDFTDDEGLHAGAIYSDDNFIDLAGGYDTYVGQAQDYSEHIIVNELVYSGTNTVFVSVPPGLNPDGTLAAYYFRFRLSPASEGSGQEPYTCTVPISPTGFVVGGEVEDYRFPYRPPLAAFMGPFTAEAFGTSVLAQWESLIELDIIGYHVERAAAPEGPWTRLTAGLITAQAMGSASGAAYDYLDTSVVEGNTYYYRLVTINKNSTEDYSDAVKVTVPVGGEPFNPPSPSAFYRIYLPIAVR